MSRRRGETARRIALLAAAVLLAGAAATPAQEVLSPTEELAFDRPEAWALNYFASVTLLTRLAAPRSREPWSIDAGIELTWVPHLSAEQRTVGFGGRKEEDLNQAPVLIRPRLTVGLPGKISVTAAWVPPVEVFGVESNLFSLALDRPLFEGERWSVGARVLAQTGSSKGAFTCTAEDVAGGDDPVANPFGCEAESSDEATLRYAGFELAGGLSTESGIDPYLAVAVSWFDNEFQVGARTFGFIDRSRLTVDGSTWSVTAGAGYPLTARSRLVGELFYTPLPVARLGEPRETDGLLNLRLLLSYRLR